MPKLVAKLLQGCFPNTHWHWAEWKFQKVAACPLNMFKHIMAYRANCRLALERETTNEKLTPSSAAWAANPFDNHCFHGHFHHHHDSECLKRLSDSGGGWIMEIRVPGGRSRDPGWVTTKHCCTCDAIHCNCMYHPAAKPNHLLPYKLITPN